MNLLIRYFIWHYAISFVDLKNVVSDENHDLGNDRKQDMVDFNLHRSNRRFKKDDDEEWHVAHLRNRDTAGSGRCKAETLQNRIARYKQSLREDASLLEFVSVDAIPVDVKDIQDPCSKVDVERRNEGDDGSTVPNNNMTKVEELKVNVTIGDVLRPATTASGRGIFAADKDLESEKKRRSEYQFSSIEYYEDTLDFDPETCPDVVDVIVLQEDDLRKIDIECELVIEWKSLE